MAMINCLNRPALLLAAGLLFSQILPAQQRTPPERLKVGYSISLAHITPENMRYAKSVGIDCIEVSFGAFIDADRNFKLGDKALNDTVQKAARAAHDAGIEIWSVHMPYGRNIDLSLPEADRRQVVSLHSKILELCRHFYPKIILFHPSYYLGLNEREVRKAQLVRSATELNKKVKEINAVMVIENMLGPELKKDETRERPLCRTVEETMEIMNRLPADIYSAVDMNHIAHPEKLIRAMGARLRSVHIADGHGLEENHYLPCSGKGGNDWPEILSALDEAGYRGPFLFESHYQDVRELSACYDSLYRAFIAKKYAVRIPGH